MADTCDRCGEQHAQTYHRVARGGIWNVYICGPCHDIATLSPAVRRACPVHHSTACGCPETTALTTEGTDRD